jgi:uridine phosphorylase
VAPPAKLKNGDSEAGVEELLASHIYHLPRGRVPERFIVCGRRERAMRILTMLKDPLERFDGDYYLGSGMHDRTEIGVCSHGIGGPSAIIAMHELVAQGARSFVRVGTCGALSPEVKLGDIVVVQDAVRDDGSENVWPGARKVEMDRALVKGLVRAAEPMLRVWSREGPAPRLHAGTEHSKYDFFAEVPDLTASPRSTHALWKKHRRAGVLVSSMESGALASKALALGKRLGGEIRVASVLVAVGMVGGRLYEPGNQAALRVDGAIDVAIAAALDALASS